MALLTRDELLHIRQLRDPDALLRTYIERWAQRLGAELDLDDALRRAVDACFGRYVYDAWAHARSAELIIHDNDCIATRLSLLQAGVVPEADFGTDIEVEAARAVRAHPEAELSRYLAASLVRDIAGWLQISESEATLRVGGPGTIDTRLRNLPAAAISPLESYRPAVTWVWLYHFGVTEVTPPNFDSRELWDSLPEEAKR